MMEVLDFIAGLCCLVAFFYVLVYVVIFALAAVAFNIVWKIWRRI